MGQHPHLSHGAQKASSKNASLPLPTSSGTERDQSWTGRLKPSYSPPWVAVQRPSTSGTQTWGFWGERVGPGPHWPTSGLAGAGTSQQGPCKYHPKLGAIRVTTSESSSRVALQAWEGAGGLSPSPGGLTPTLSWALFLWLRVALAWEGAENVYPSTSCKKPIRALEKPASLSGRVSLNVEASGLLPDTGLHAGKVPAS